MILTVHGYFQQVDRRYSYYPGETFSPEQLRERGMAEREIEHQKRRGLLIEAPEASYQSIGTRSLDLMLDAAQQQAATAAEPAATVFSAGDDPAGPAAAPAGD